MPKVPIFLSFSGPRSEAVAKLLRDWLPQVLQAVEPWSSALDIEAGERWGVKIGEALQSTNFGILCLTPENTNPEPATWIAFEAGTLSKQMDASRVTCLCCFGVQFGSLKSPLNQFQNAKADDLDFMVKLASSINTQLGEDGIRAPDGVRRAVEKWWPDWQGGLATAEMVAPPVEAKKPDIGEQLGEILARLRDIEAALSSLRGGSSDHLLKEVSRILAERQTSARYRDDLYKRRVLLEERLAAVRRRFEREPEDSAARDQYTEQLGRLLREMDDLERTIASLTSGPGGTGEK